MRRAAQSTVRSVSAVQAERLLGTTALLVDVREGSEWTAGHAPAAVHVPMSRIAALADRLPGDRTLVCVCHVGARSAVVAAALVRAGYDAVNLAGGMDAWAAAGLPIVDDDGRPGTII